MSGSEYYVHNFSPFIFEVSDIPFDMLLANHFALAGVAFLFLAIGAGLWFFQKSLVRQGKSTGLIDALQSLFLFATIAFVGMFALHKSNIQWGLRWYSSMYLFGFIYAYYSCRYWISKRSIMMTPLQLDSLIAHGIIGMILGARMAYVFIYNWDSYSQNLGDILKVWEGGLSFHGGIVGVIVALLLFCKRNKVPFWHLVDKICLTVPFGIGMGRIGNFMNGELYGRVVDSTVPWAMVFAEGGPQPRHPSQIYQSLGEGWLLLLTLHLINRIKSRYQGSIATAFIFFYGIYRYFVEFFREPDEQLKYYFSNTTTMGQILCFITSLVAVGLYFGIIRNNPKTDSPELLKDIEDYISKQEISEQEQSTTTKAT